MNILRPPGKRTTGISPAHIRSRRLQTDKPRHTAASFSDNNRGELGLAIHCVFVDRLLVRFPIGVCPTCAQDLLSAGFSPLPLSGGQHVAMEKRNQAATYKYFPLRIEANVLFPEP